MTTSNDPLVAHCPLCEKANNCQVDNPNGCWCKNTSIPAAIIDRANAVNPKRNRCVCQQCIISAVEKYDPDANP